MTATAVPFARVEIVPEAQQAALDVLRSGWITMGPETAAFERELACYLGARQVVAVSSGDRGPGDRAAGAASARRRHRAHPEPHVLSVRWRPSCRPACARSWWMWTPGALLPTPETAAAAARRAGRPAAMVIQHMAGHPADVAELAAAAGLPAGRIVEDAAHGIGAELRGAPVGGTVPRGLLQLLRDQEPAHRRGRRDRHRRRRAGRPGSRDAAARHEPRRLAALSPRRQLALRRRRARPQGEHDRCSGRDRPRPARLPAGLAAAPRAAGRGRTTRLWPTVPGLILPQRPAHGRHAWHLYQVRVTPGCAVSRDVMIDAAGQAGNRHVGALHPGPSAFRLPADPAPR